MSSGTQSPPIEDAAPLGKTDREGGTSEGVQDADQRKGYFKGESGSGEKNIPDAASSGIEQAAQTAKTSVGLSDERQKSKEEGQQKF